MGRLVGTDDEGTEVGTGEGITVGAVEGDSEGAALGWPVGM